MTTVDLSSGLDPGTDYPIVDAEADLSTGENNAFWVFDDSGSVALLNCHLHAGASHGYTQTTAHGGPMQESAGADIRREAFTFVLPGERLLVDWATGDATTPAGPGAAGWRFRCEEPFIRWSGHYRGAPRVTTPAELQQGVIDLTEPRTAVECDLELEMAAPAWIQGTFAEPGPGTEQALGFIGVPRYEQLYRARGAVRVDGEKHPISGTGLRTHRYGRRDVTGIAGHSWLSAVFPSGRAFGLMRFPRPDGTVLFREAYVTGPDGLVGATVIDSPWLTSLDFAGETFTVRLETADGATTIDGQVLATGYTMGLGVNHAPGSWVICHAMARYRWDGEEACGLLERSAPIEALT